MARNWRASAARFGLRGDPFWPGGDFGRVVSGPQESRFPETETVFSRDSFECRGYRAGKTQHLALTGPFRGQVAESGHAHSVGETPIDGRLDEVGREERERDRHVDLPHAAALTFGDAFGIRSGIGHEFVEPAAPPCNRCDQERAVLGTDGAGFLRRSGFGQENFTASG